ncbi:hypothetical protein H7849_20410 [Alloacidobacterium dinghuense]|uniref:Uncharacterized protein n=1 Tax=Alloacidobacterium dinghuense TaxID=2763107 RepID=A0A7G8BFU5_9BACT|nr:hypothetical protein [Alloacidobacterium dinghuense]QNI31415.1 hypothetical protein H7849_20410 [Alloacidobacterium dinghuense]
MDIRDIVAELEKEIARLNQIVTLLKRSNGDLTPKTETKRRTLSAEAKKKIADAQRKRWAKAKQAAK